MAKKGKGLPECPHSLGYLASRPKNARAPQKCLVCQKILECMRGQKHNEFSLIYPLFLAFPSVCPSGFGGLLVAFAAPTAFCLVSILYLEVT